MVGALHLWSRPRAQSSARRTPRDARGRRPDTTNGRQSSPPAAPDGTRRAPSPPTTNRNRSHRRPRAFGTRRSTCPRRRAGGTSPLLPDESGTWRQHRRCTSRCRNGRVSIVEERGARDSASTTRSGSWRHVGWAPAGRPTRAPQRANRDTSFSRGRAPRAGVRGGSAFADPVPSRPRRPRPSGSRGSCSSAGTCSR
jgi:hypothetical protein